jgi:hypothetical protein
VSVSVMSFLPHSRRLTWFSGPLSAATAPAARRSTANRRADLLSSCRLHARRLHPARLHAAEEGAKRRGNSYPDPVNSWVSTTVLIGRGDMIGSAWRCTILQVSPSRRKIMVTRSATGLMSPLPANRAWPRSIWTT